MIKLSVCSTKELIDILLKEDFMEKDVLFESLDNKQLEEILIELLKYDYKFSKLQLKRIIQSPCKKILIDNVRKIKLVDL